MPGVRMWARVSKKVDFHVTILTSLLIFCGFQVLEISIDLKPQKSILNPKEFYILKVSDLRKVKGPIGSIITSDQVNSQKLTYQPLNLKGGTLSSIEHFITKTLTNRSDLRPVVLNVKEFKVSEDIQSNGTINGRVEAVFSFDFIRNGQAVNLIEYKGGSRYTRSKNNAKSLEPVLANTIINALQYFDKWINLQVSSNEDLAESVRLSMSDYDLDIKKDTLFYSANRKLSWTDFKSTPDMSSRFAAEIFPFFSFEQNNELNNGILEVKLVFKTYLVRNFSWVKSHARTPYTLNHEQRHFDIMKITTENFKKKIRAENMTLENYQGILAVEYLESLREMNRLQKQYDSETNHGLNITNQQKWNVKVDSELYKTIYQNARN